MSSDPSAPLPTPTNYQRTTGGGHLSWQPPTPEHLQEMLPAYEVVSILGQGGMGAVYKGRQKSLDRVVAIKILPPEAAEDDMQFAERFKNEARTMAKMNHPAIVHVYDFGETSEGQLYIVMEFIDGTDVAKMIQSQGKLPEDYALSITAHVCDALGYAHTQGVVHRDIKPANVLITMAGQIKVADFGLAKATDPSQMGLTKTNMALGTPDFVSPEALMPGVPLDGRADLYAVGVMLYNMLTGTIPRGAFRMPSATLQTDARFDKIILKSMEMDRTNRYQTAQDLRRDLDVILTTPAAKSGGQTLPAQSALPQKPMGKSPSAPPQRKEGSASVPAGSAKPPQGTAKPATGKASTAPAKKSNPIMIYGIAAAVVVAGGALLFSGGGKKPAPAPKAVAETKPEPKKPQSKPATPPPAAPKPKTAESKPALVGAKSSPVEPVLTNSLGMKFVPVPIIGGPTNGQRVLFSVWETRVQDYAVFAKETKREWKKPDFEQGPTHPAVMMTWDDAQAFCVWMTQRDQKMGKLGANERYRLPSDHEWSCAVGIGDREDAAKLPSDKSSRLADTFPWGSAWPPPEHAGNLWSEEVRPAKAAGKYPPPPGEIAGYHDGFAETAPVGGMVTLPAGRTLSPSNRINETLRSSFTLVTMKEAVS